MKLLFRDDVNIGRNKKIKKISKHPTKVEHRKVDERNIIALKLKFITQVLKTNYKKKREEKKEEDEVLFRFRLRTSTPSHHKEVLQILYPIFELLPYY